MVFFNPDIVKRMLSEKRITIVGVAIFFVVIIGSSLFRSFNHDEFEALHSAWKVFSGERIYVDFLQHHHFLLYYSLWPVFVTLGEGVPAIIAARVFSFLMTAGILILTYRIAMMQYDRRTALLSVFFLSSSVTFLQKSIEIRPDVPLVLMELVSSYLLLDYFRSKKVWKLCASSIALFVGFLFLQKAVFLGILFGLLFAYRLYRKTSTWAEAFAYFGMLALMTVGFVYFVSTTFGLDTYLFLNWKINTQLLNSFPLYKYLMISFGQNPVVWALFFGGAVMFRRRPFDVISYLGFGLLGFIFFTKSPFPQYYLMSFPFVAISSAVTFARFDWRKPAFAKMALVISVPIALYAVDDAWKDNREQLAKIEYVLTVTDPSDIVYDGDAQFNVFRKDMDYFWFSVKPKTGVLSSYRLSREYSYDAYDLIGERLPKVISSSFIKPKDSRIADHYVRSEVFGDLYIRNEGN